MNFQARLNFSDKHARRNVHFRSQRTAGGTFSALITLQNALAAICFQNIAQACFMRMRIVTFIPGRHIFHLLFKNERSFISRFLEQRY